MVKKVPLHELLSLWLREELDAEKASLLRSEAREGLRFLSLAYWAIPSFREKCKGLCSHAALGLVSFLFRDLSDEYMGDQLHALMETLKKFVANVPRENINARGVRACRDFFASLFRMEAMEEERDRFHRTFPSLF